MLGADTEAGAARDEHFHRWRGRDQLRHRRCRAYDLLEVVEHEQRAATGVRQCDGVDQVASALRLNARRRGDGRRDPRRIVKWREVDEHDTTQMRLELTRDLNRESRLPRSSGTGERQKPNVWPIEKRGSCAELCLAANHLVFDVGQW